MVTLLGGLVGQEVLKAVSGRFHPLHQWLYLDAMLALPDVPPTYREGVPTGSRYDPQVALFGTALQEKLGKLNVFLVGAGALGCELLKTFASMGVACGGGTVTVADDDDIEKSNLTRQFLFRDSDIGRSKSVAAAAAAKAINPNLNVVARVNRVSPDTESVFDDHFWESQDVVVGALDNVDARRYVDARCVQFGKPLLESGTLGTRCSTQVITPHHTETYSASGPQEPSQAAKQVASCTLRDYPHNITHCLMWARSEFEGLFSKTPDLASAFLHDPSVFRKRRAELSAEDLSALLDLLTLEPRFEACVAWAVRRFHMYFHERVVHLTSNFPQDALTDTGVPFWSAPKRFPQALGFAVNDEAHVKLLQAAAILHAGVLGIALPEWASDIQAISQVAANVDLSSSPPPKASPAPKAEREAPADVPHRCVIDDLMVQLEAVRRLQQTSHTRLALRATQFQKDDDGNYHVAFVCGLANMRARCYEIAECDMLKAKLVAGNIIPAIVTATAVAVGPVCLELYKVLQGKAREQHRNAFVDLAEPSIVTAEPEPPAVMRWGDQTWTEWDHWEVDASMTVQQLIDWFQAKHLTAYYIGYRQNTLYNNSIKDHAEHLQSSLRDRVLTVAGQMDERACVDLHVLCDDVSGNEVKVPPIRAGLN